LSVFIAFVPWVANANELISPMVDVYVRAGEIVLNGKGEQVRRIDTPNASYQRIQLRIEGAGLENAVVRINTADGRPIQRLTGDELRRSQWTNVVQGSKLELVFSPGDPGGGQLFIEQVVGRGHTGKLLSQVGDTDETQPILDFRYEEKIYAQARSVAFLSFIKRGLPGECTGFLVENGLVTNHHCIASVEDCESAVAVFGFELLPDGSTDAGEQFKCRSIVRGAPELDLVLLDLDGEPQARYGSLTDRGEPRAGVAAYIIQHPSGGPKMIAYKSCSVDQVGAVGLSTSVFSHLCDTDHGSSGAPVFDVGGRLIGVHRYGFNDGTDRWQTNRAVRIDEGVLERPREFLDNF
jgi:S1-C subfamily serine protease